MLFWEKKIYERLSYLEDSAVFPSHTLPTSYAYQSLNGVENSFAPDNTGNSRFWYDRLGRVVFSHNWEQYSPANGGVANRYSYTNYDAQGRIIEVGEKSGTTTLAATPFLTDTQVNTMNTTGTNTQITRTYYDEPYAAAGLAQDNLRKRVSAVTYQDAATGGPQQATYYSYDQIGNMKTLWQQIQDLGTKRVDYQYDLVSGKVNKVRYQQGAADRFFYNYEYDAENRLIKARTGINSTSGDAWEIENPKTDAAYRYYLHGPLARMELGNTALVQGLDYAYTLQGWLKGVNGNYLSAANDMGKDGVMGGTRAVVGRDAYAYTLDYFSGDYQPIGTGQTAITLNWGSQSGDVMGRNLYNGNISRSTLALSNINSGASVGYTYRYDQLNRLTAMRQHGLTAGATTWNTTSIGFPFKEDVKYDGNGNILNYVRYGSGASGKTLPMDSMNYVYTKDALGYLKNNRLTQVLDRVSGDPYTNDISNQAANNYLYDNIGNLIKDVEGGVSNIQWTVYGKIKSITKSDGSSLEYRYDAGGNRIYKAYTHSGVTDKTWYVRDAQGNTLAIYGNKDGGSTLYWKEQELYGSSRLGIWTPDVAVGTDVSSIWDNLGIKHYELSNHLGNVLATISDKPVQEGDHYKAELLSAQDYYPFGMLQPDRRYSLGTYRYGFNGKENDNEVKGEGNSLDFGARVYDPRTGRFLSVDPLTKKYAELTPYQFASNKPINSIDLDGLEGWELTTPLHNLTQQIIISNDKSAQQKRAFAQQMIMNQPVVQQSEPDFGYVAEQKKAFQRQIEYNKEMEARYALDPTGQDLARSPVMQAAAMSVLPESALLLGGAQAYVGIKDGDYVKAGFGALTMAGGASGTIAKYAPRFPLSEIERKILNQSQSVLNSKEFNVIKDAYKNGVVAEINVGGTKVLYEPEFTYAEAMTLHGEGGFILGPKAFTSQGGVQHTVIWEITSVMSCLIWRK